MSVCSVLYFQFFIFYWLLSMGFEGARKIQINQDHISVGSMIFLQQDIVFTSFESFLGLDQATKLSLDSMKA